MSNLKYDPPRYANGKRTREGECAENSRKRDQRRPLTERRLREQARRDQAAYELKPEYWGQFLYRIWTPEDIERWYAFAHVGGSRVIVKRSEVEKLKTMDLVPNEPFRIAFNEAKRGARNSGQTTKAVELILDELRKLEARDGKDYGADRYEKEHRLLIRDLGVERRWAKDGGSLLTIFVAYPVAEACCKALRLDPVTCGI